MSKFVLTAQLRLKAPTNTKAVIDELRRQLQGVNIPVKIKGAAEAKKQLDAVGNSAKRASTAAHAMGKSFGLAFKRFAAFTVASRAVSLFTNSLANAIDEAISFQREIIKISQVTGKTVQSLKGLERTITSLSVTMGVNSKELLSTTRVLSQAGIKADDLNVALTALAKTTLAPTFENISKTAEGAIAILAQFKEGVGALERQLGSINAVAGQFAVESGDLIGAVRRVGGVFVEAGGTLEEFIGLFTSVRATTRESSESIATGLRTIFTRIQRPKTIKFLRQYGVELQNLDGSFVGPYEAVRRLNDALSGLGKGDITFIKIAEQLGGFRQIGKVIPLLKEFELAERARQAAIAGGESLEADKIKAQAALAVQIVKVKEEFLALVRSLADTTSFQTMVKTALGLASALIKVADAIKPLIPLIGAFAAFKMAKGIGGFASGIGGALKGVGKNQGGRIHAFARGGMVPGQGNRDTVPAMLQPGEFVMRKSSVNKMGAGRLAAMNENKYASGGIIGLHPFEKRRKDGSVISKDFPKQTGVVGLTDLASKLRGKLGASSPDVKALKKNLPVLAARQGVSTQMKMLAKYGRFNVHSKGIAIGDKDIGEATERSIKTKFKNLVNNSTKPLERFFGTKAKGITSAQIDSFGMNGVIGNALEAILSSLGAPFDHPPQDELQRPSTKSDNNSAFDFPRGLGRLATRVGGSKKFTQLANVPTDAKRTVTTEYIKDVITKKFPNLMAEEYKTLSISKGLDIDAAKKKQISGILASKSTSKDSEIHRALGGEKSGLSMKEVIRQRKAGKFKFASGGAISGSDTVSAMLTPGEFVLNKGASKSIGYGNLGRMNKSGVAGFAAGGKVTSGRHAYGTGPPDKPKGGGEGMFMAMIGIQTALAMLAPTIDETSTAFEKSSAKFVQGLNMAITGLFMFKMMLTSMGTGMGAFASGSFGKGVGGKAKSAIRGRGASMIRAGSERGQVPGTGGFSFAAKMGRVPKAGMKASMSRGVGRAMVGMSASVGKVTGQLTGMLGPMALATAAFYAITAVIDSFLALEDQKQRAMKAGNAAMAGELAVRQKGQGAINKFGIGLVAAAAGIGFMTPAGPLGAAAGALLALTVVVAMKVIPGLDTWVAEMGTFFGGDSGEITKQKIANEMSAASAAKDLARNSSLAAKELSRIKFGKSTAGEGLKSGGALVRQRDKERKTQQAKLKTAKQSVSEKGAGLEDRANRVQKLKAGMALPGVGAGFALAAAADNAGLMMQVKALEKAQGEELAIRKANNEAAKAGIQELMDKGAFKSLGQQISLASGDLGDFGGNFKNFMQHLKENNLPLFNDIMSTGIVEVEKQFMNQAEELKKTVDYLKALNFGLRGVNGAMDAAIAGFDMITSASEIGANQFTSSAAILEASLTAAGKNISKGQLDGALVDLENTLREFGASDDLIEQSTSTIRGVNQAQRTNVDRAMQKVRSSTERSDPKWVQKILSEELLQGIGGPAAEQMQAVIDGMGDFTEVEMKQIEAESTAPILKKIFDPLEKSIKEQVITSMEKRGEIEDKLSEALKKRRTQELEFIDAQRKAIDTQLEAAKLFESFGGAKLTSDQQLGARRAQANLSLGNAGVGGLRGGGAKDIRRALSDIGTKFNKQASAVQVGIQGKQRGALDPVTGKPFTAAFQGAEGDKNKQDELKTANEAIITFTKQRITLIQEELQIAQQKNKAEKDALDKLLGGDIEGFLEGQLASAAGAALRTGDASLASSFGAGALGAGFKTLAGQGLSDREMQRAAGLSLSSVGITDPRSAQVMAGTTAEMKAKKAEGRELSQILGEGAQQQADLEKIDITTAEVRITNGVINLDNIRRAVEGRDAAGHRYARGGTVYASRGMFVSRGTDTIPAMLTPGEFVVNRASVNRGNNLSMLRAMNGGGGARGMSSGGSVSYYTHGGGADGNKDGLAGVFGTISEDMGKNIIDPLKNMFDSDSSSLAKIFGDFSTSVQKLLDFQLSVKVDPTSVTVNFNGANFLAGMKESIRNELLDKVREELKNIKFNDVGDAVQKPGGLGG